MKISSYRYISINGKSLDLEVVANQNLVIGLTRTLATEIDYPILVKMYDHILMYAIERNRGFNVNLKFQAYIHDAWVARLDIINIFDFWRQNNPDI